MVYVLSPLDPVVSYDTLKYTVPDGIAIVLSPTDTAKYDLNV